jgi:hypothetical protein
MFPPRYQKAEWIDFTVCCLAFVFGKSGALLQKPFAFGQQRLRGNPNADTVVEFERSNRSRRQGFAVSTSDAALRSAIGTVKAASAPRNIFNPGKILPAV